MPVPPVERPDSPAWFYCGDCGQAYDPQHGHACDPLGAPRGVLTGLGIAIVFWILVLAGVVTWRVRWP